MTWNTWPAVRSVRRGWRWSPRPWIWRASGLASPPRSGRRQLVASAIVLALGAVVTRGAGTPWPALLAPALAGVGIAYAYGPGIDPAFELARTMALSGRLILLVRGLAVFGVNALLGAVASVFAEGFAGVAFGWLAPMTVIAALALAGWCLALLGGLADTGNLAAATQPGFAPAYLLLAAVCVGLALYATSGATIGGETW